MPREASKTAPRLTSVQGLRAFAAILVVFMHLRREDGSTSALWYRFTQAGYTGVDVFFVLSGFIILYVHRRDLGNSEKAAAFCQKRLLRIYPLYWLVIGVKLVLTYLPGNGGARYSLGAILASASLLTQDPARMLGPSWSLTYEILFYGIFLLGIVGSGRLLRGILVVWTVAILAAAPLDQSRLTTLISVILSTRNLGFVLGVAVAGLLQRETPDPRRSAQCSALGALVFGLAYLGVDAFKTTHPGVSFSPLLGTLPFAVGGALLLYGLVGLERTRGFTMPRPLVFVGDASYSIYLTHIFAGNLIWAALRRLHIDTGSLFVSALVPFLGVGVGCVVYVLVERPLLARLGRLVARRPLVRAESPVP